MNLTNDELRAKGFVLGDNGEWYKPTRGRVRADDPGKVAVLERDIRVGTLGTVQAQKRVSGKFLVRVTSFRRILLDEDNLCEKFVVDLCRYAGIIPGDAASQTKIEVAQEKVGRQSQEYIRIEIFKVE